MSLRELRERLQGPRRPYDTWYGRNVMRVFSIYFTVLFSRVNVSPSFVTFLSLVAGLVGAWHFGHARWMLGFFWLNLWYLLDHSDGELARFRQASSASGLYFDTIVNAIVPPLSLAALGFALHAAGGGNGFFWAGLAAAYGSLMLLMISFCEAAVLLQVSKGGAIPPPSPAANAGKASPMSVGRLFGALHTAVAFPTFLPAATVMTVVVRLLNATALVPALGFLLTAYAVAITLVWTAVLAKMIVSKQADRRLAGLR